MFVIITDGCENASRIYDSDTVKAMIEEQKREHGWEFLFIGANIDAVETAKNFGIDAERAVDYHADAKGTAVVYETVSRAVCDFREAVPLQSDWGEKIEEDFRKRK